MDYTSNGKTKLGYLWACSAPRGDVIFHWETHSALSSWPNGSRAATYPDNIIPVDFGGTLQCDGYEAGDRSGGGEQEGAGRWASRSARRRGSRIVLAGCMAHVRRKFRETREPFRQAQIPKPANVACLRTLSHSL